MNHRFALPLLALIVTAATATAAIYVPPIEERAHAAELIVVGIITLEKTEDGWHHGHITVARTLKGEAEVGSKISARWKAPKPKPVDPKLPQLADYTYRPTLDAEQIVLLNTKPEGEESYVLNWGNTEPPTNEDAVKDALTAPGKKG